jgi:TolB protein
MTPRIGRRAFGAAVLASLAGVACGAQPAATPTSALNPKVLPTVTASPVTGHLLLVHGGNAFDFDLATLRETQLSHFNPNVFLTTPALSPDRRQLAYTFYVMPSDPKDLGGSDLYVSNADTSAPRQIRAHPRSGASFEEPSWSADGNAIFATVRESGSGTGSDVVTINQVGVKDGEMKPVVSNAQSPSASPDGKHLAYLTRDANGVVSHLLIAGPDGSSPRELAADAKFTMVRAPRFSPDGNSLAFAAVGGPTPPPTRTASLFVGVAEAHGTPWEIWTIRPDGTNLHRLTDEQEDSPTPAWSPDGRWIAFAGEIGTYLVDAAGRKTLCLTTIVSAGGLVRAPLKRYDRRASGR